MPKDEIKKKQTIDRLKYIAITSGLIAILLFYFRDSVAEALYWLDWYFLVFLVTAIDQFTKGDIMMGILCLVIQISAWLLATLLFKVAVIDTFYPVFRVVTPQKDAYRFCRKVCRTKGEDPHYMYFMVKFHMRPVLRWHKLKLPRPEYVMVGFPFINRRKKYIDNGIKGITWRRTPANMDILSPNMHVNFNDKENCYELGLKLDIYREDNVERYEKLAFEEVQAIGTNVIESVKGDWGLIKDQFHQGIVVRERDLPIPEEEYEEEERERDLPIPEEDYGGERPSEAIESPPKIKDEEIPTKPKRKTLVKYNGARNREK